MTRRATMLEDRAHSAIVEARKRSRRSWRVYLAGLVVLIVLIGGFVARIYQSSEIRAVHLTRATKSAKALPDGGLPVRMSQKWHVSDQLALGVPVYLDVVVTYSEHTVTGRDAVTGAPRWSYTRSDRRMCSVIVQEGIAVALYAHDGNCDEATGLDAANGTRTWVRTLFDSGTDVTVSAINGEILFTTPGATNLIDPSNGQDRWYDAQPAGCVTRSAVLGTAGVLLASDCTSGQDTLSLRGAASDKKRDWSVPLAGRTPIAADSIIAVLEPGGTSVQILNSKGVRRATTKLPRPLTAPVRTGAFDTFRSTVEFASVGGGVLGLHDLTGRFRWWRPLPALPVQTSAGLILAGSGQVQVIAPGTGRVSTEVPAAAVVPGDQLALLGRGVVAGNAAGTSAFG